MSYIQEVDDSLEDLIKHGFCRLPSVKKLVNQTGVFEKCVNEMGSKTYMEGSRAQLDFLKTLGIYDNLSAKLYKIAQSKFNFSGPETESYNVSRLVRPGDNSEGYRGHFDAHLFTLVIPINIPSKGKKENRGQLNFFPNLRKHPRNELENVAGKIRYKKFASENGFIKLRDRHENYIEDFLDYRPLLFIGTTTLHGNAPVDISSSEQRLSCLSHYFDPAAYGLSAMLRKLRRR